VLNPIIASPAKPPRVPEQGGFIHATRCCARVFIIASPPASGRSGLIPITAHGHGMNGSNGCSAWAKLMPHIHDAFTIDVLR
jgi:hypothetical protein